MSGTLSDAIIDAHALGDETDGDYVRVRLDAVLGHDATIALLIEEFRRRKLTLWDPARVLFVNDHFSPPATIERANISRQFIRFAREEGVRHLAIDRGICHQLLVEHPLCSPGSLIVGADSHTIMGGALGACCTGMGTTDVLYALATGTTWLRRPPSIKLELSGRLPQHCSGRDVILAIAREFGEDGARYCAVEIHDGCDPRLAQDERFAIANMLVECGAKFGLFVPDTVTLEYCARRDGHPYQSAPAPAAEARYQRTLRLDLSALEPLVAKPYSPANVSPLREVVGTKITYAFLGSCSSGRLEDLRVAAEVMQGQNVHPDVRFVVIPASAGIFHAALQAGYVETLSRAGVLFNQTSCGPCGGIDKGLLGADDVCVSTSSRNFRGRMGDRNSRTYLASARTVAYAALSGELVNHA
jgi:3-isopropylmalate/(R)-2-methylmalate dehydratase large subunit